MFVDVTLLWIDYSSFIELGTDNKNCGKVFLYPQLMNTRLIGKIFFHASGTMKKARLTTFQHINRAYYVY